MGVDIYAHRGVVVTATALAHAVTEDNRELACRTLLRYAATTLQLIKADSDDNSPSTAKLLVTVFNSLSIETTVKELQQMLVEMAPAHVDGIDSYVVNGDEAIEIWGELIEV
ncbi:hypothetical protein N9Z53_04705, partial [Mariniblastus sp.]|nr:hypothetical protein [Mariniblastus sp.]